MSRDLSHAGECATGLCVENISAGASRTWEAESIVETRTDKHPGAKSHGV